jgi:divalent metal cation (Fe/Co/Zn/Cd) transporter
MDAPNRSPSPEHLRAAFRVSVVSVAWTVCASAAAIVSGIVAHALVLVVFGLTGVLDAAGSWTLALHFRHALEHETISIAREELALRIVSVGLMTIGLFTVEESARRLATGGAAHHSAVGIVITGASIVGLTGLTARKRWAARLVRSKALLADSWLSATGAALAVIAIVGTALGTRASWIDPVAALLVALIAAGVGIGFLRREERSLEDE